MDRGATSGASSLKLFVKHYTAASDYLNSDHRLCAFGLTPSVEFKFHKHRDLCWTAPSRPASPILAHPTV